LGCSGEVESTPASARALEALQQRISSMGEQTLQALEVVAGGHQAVLQLGREQQ
jgi:hypothetical protein